MNINEYYVYYFFFFSNYYDFIIIKVCISNFKKVIQKQKILLFLINGDCYKIFLCGRYSII